MDDRWGIYNGKSRDELNPYRLRCGDLVIAPDGQFGKLDRPGFKWGYLEGCDRPYALVDLKPAVLPNVFLDTRFTQHTADVQRD
ncbi:MAG: hypothetical protein ACFE0I_08775 [Elainellaceae cyanobacterium]